MLSKASIPYLERKKIIPAQLRHTAKYPFHAMGFHFRPVVYPAQMLPPDKPSTRLLTQTMEQRVPHVPVVPHVPKQRGPLCSDCD